MISGEKAKPLQMLSKGLIGVIKMERKSMESNIYPSRPDWLTDELIAEFRNDIAICPSPFTQEEVDELEFDAPFDFKKHNAYMAIKILKRYGIPF